MSGSKYSIKSTYKGFRAFGNLAKSRWHAEGPGFESLQLHSRLRARRSEAFFEHRDRGGQHTEVPLTVVCCGGIWERIVESIGQ